MGSDAPKLPKSNRRWYVRHLLTGLVLAIVVGGLVAANIVGNPDHGWPPRWGVVCKNRLYGWPRRCVMRTTLSEIQWDAVSSTLTSRVISVSYSVTETIYLVTNAVVALAILVSTAVVSDRLRRSWTGRRQFRLATLMWLTAVATVLLAFRETEPNWILPHYRTYNPVCRKPLWVRIPLLFGIGCTVYVAGQIGVWIVGRTVAKVARMLRTQ